MVEEEVVDGVVIESLDSSYSIAGWGCSDSGTWASSIEHINMHSKTNIIKTYNNIF